MTRLQAYRFEMRPDRRQARLMAKFAGSCRYVWNKALTAQKANQEAGSEFIGYVSMASAMVGWKKEQEWLADSPSHCYQQTLRDLDKAYRLFFAKRAALPNFKKKGKSRDSFRFPDPKQFRIEQGNSRLFLPKLGWMRYRNSRHIEGAPKNITVSREGEKWFFSVQTEREVSEPAHPHPEKRIGIDVGVANFCATSNRMLVSPANSYKKRSIHLARAQRVLSRRKKFSKNWLKQKKKIGKIHRRIASCRNDFLHKLSTDLSKNHAMLVLEDLQIKNMTRSARGNRANPGSRIRQKSGLNRAILDQGWGEFARQVEYKSSWRGGLVIKVPPGLTSQRCSKCQTVDKYSRRSQAVFLCVACGFKEHADINASNIILGAGLALSACGGLADVRLPAKQEPTEEVSYAALN